MADTLERLTVLIEANTASYERSMKKLQQTTSAAINQSAGSFKALDAPMRQLKDNAARLFDLLGVGHGGAFAAIGKDIAEGMVNPVGLFGTGLAVATTAAAALFAAIQN